MRIIPRFPIFLALLLLAACGDALGPGAVHGAWLNRTESSNPWSRHDIRLELRDDGSYTWETTAYADWGRPGDKLLGYGHQHGRYELAGDSLFLSGERTVSWDHLTGGPSEIDLSGQAPARYGVRVVSNQLVLEFVSYPADAAVQSRMVFRRD